MLVKSKKLDKVFVPIQITLTLESEHEAKVFREFMSRNITVPEFLVEQGYLDTKGSETLTGMMSQLNASACVG